MSEVSRFVWRLMDGIRSASRGRSISTAFLIKVAGVGVALLTQLLLARLLGVTEYGRYQFAFTVATMLALLANLGYPAAVVRFVSQYVVKREWSQLKGLVRGTLGITLASSFFVASIAALAYWSLPGSPTRAVLLAFVLIPLISIKSLGSALAQGLKAMVLAYAPDMVFRSLLLMTGALLVVVFFGTLTSTAVIWVLAVTYAVLVTSQLALLFRRLPAEFRSALPSYHHRSWRQVAFPLFLVASSGVVLDRTDIVMLGVLSGDAEVGVYSAALKMAQLTSMGLFAVNAIAAPVIAELYVEESRERLQAFALRASGWALVPTVAVFAGFVLLGKAVLRLFGAEFVGGYWVLVILAAAHVVNAMVGSVGHLLSMTGRQRHTARVFAIGALVNILLNGAMIPLWGGKGAAIASAVSTVFWNVWLYALVRNTMQIEASWVGKWILDRGRVA